MKHYQLLGRRYRVELVKSRSDHELSERVEGDEELFVIRDDGKWWFANEFFHSTTVIEFVEVIKT